MEQQNDFMILRQIVNNAVNQYTNLRKRIDWKDKGKYATIMRLAKPFLTGYFTIAIAGKMSAGKSTFINSLIGENLLPTGRFQTTSGITWIVSSDKRYMEVTYADGKKKTFTHDLAKELRDLVAIPEKFDSLPINHINNLIKGNNNIKEILEKKEGIEAMTHQTASEELWKEYVAAMPKSKIPTNVVIYLQLPKEYEGWRIVDTPGIGAVGGIQDATKKLLMAKDDNNESYAVDAVVLLHSSKENIQDEMANTFAEDIRKSMGDLATGRLFFVLTHASDESFIQHQTSTLDKAEALFGSKLNIPREKINYIDSLVHRFITSAKKSNKDFSAITAMQAPLEGWNDDEWSIIKKIVSPIYMECLMSGTECTNTILFENLEKISRFEALRSMLYNFLNEEKSKAFEKLLNLIQSEFEAYSETLKKDIQTVSNGKKAIDEQIREVQREQNQLNIALGKLRDEATPGVINEKFSFVDTELQKLSQLKSIGEVRTAYLQIIKDGLSTEKELFSSLIAQFSAFLGKYQHKSSTFASIDFDQIERDAEQMSYVKDKSRPEKGDKIKDGGFSGDDVYATHYPHKKLDFDKKRREFTALVIRKGRTQCTEFKNGLNGKIEKFFNIASDDIKEKTNATIQRLEDYKLNLANEDAILSDLRTKLSCVDSALSELKKFED
ncbi:MAG: hypothetical protein HDS64_08715 [Bacteroidales bacterium]|nr:hypothetical protein [Bacteroidales bacterium]MBD5293375.1 hypothetical protein [Bacteroides sp.]